ncbi:hypothetical protein HC251_02905 [Iamia sp. SCSIO 61187]|uniref:Calx-beta domain-containing protein n=1 Tax=Iamia sp. SCSIO 61187 TaxID=2722752 RepID=UPI001C627A1C|nr:hypothetical protein [Iamia sp. SCSIO 61187]QYG91488.1 hypothetical protein HC251_02905 [Iamia sp. SCSIO 61187]
MNRTTRRLTAALALALGLGLAPTAAGAADGDATLRPTPLPAVGADGYAIPTPTPPPPVGSDDLAVARPSLSIELDAIDEVDFHMPGRLVLSSPLDVDLSTQVQVLFPDADPEDVSCPEVDFGLPCSWTFGVDVPAGATEVPFELEILDDQVDEDAEVLRVAVTSTHPDSAVQVGPAADALIYDGAGLEVAIVDDPEAAEGDPGSDGTLDLVVEANQAVPHPVTFRVRTGVVGGYNGALPGVDHQAVDVVVELPAGDTTRTVEVPLVGDDLVEPDELLFGSVEDPSHGAIAFDGGTTVARILDDDVAVGGWSRPGGFTTR